MRPAAILVSGAVLLVSACGGTVPGPTGPPAGGPALHADLRAPEGLTLDTNGNLYVSELEGARVVKIDGNGELEVVAGTGTAGFSGDGGQATQALLAAPAGLALDAQGELVIADRGNDRIRRVGAAGTIETIRGSPSAGLNGPAGVAVTAEGDVYVADQQNARVLKIKASGRVTRVAGGGSSDPGDGGRATAARLSRPSYVLLDQDGNLLFTDSGANRIRRIDPHGVITTIAGTGEAGFSGDGGPATGARLHSPTGLALDADGNLYVSDSGNNRVRRISARGTITTLAGTGDAGFGGDGGDAAAAKLDAPADLEVDAVGSIYVADQGNGRVRVIDHDGVIDSIAGGGMQR
jgi:DNA-binding beta-propeller fold protein YncE